VRIPTRIVLLLLECLVNHTAAITRRKCEDPVPRRQTFFEQAVMTNNF
jgi:hypothetical protein